MTDDLDPEAGPAALDGASGAVRVGSYPDARTGWEHSLVVLAMGETCWLVPEEARHHLLVEPNVAALVREQLRRYDDESGRWPPAPVVDPNPPRRLRFAGPLLWGAVVLALFRAQAEHPEWITAGALDAQAVFGQGEWWRLVTALFLHADVAHVTANVVSGVVLFSLVLATFGPRAGWLWLLFAAVGGNLAVAMVHYGEAYRSIGASTAVFAALGLITGRAAWLVVRAGRPMRWRMLAVPVAAGLTLLGLWGAGGARVDVVAHFTGFLAGLVLGAWVARTTFPAARLGLGFDRGVD
jgi:rhomboid protease GluP